ncbi:MAG: protein phosphatase CheZ [Pseudomonadota bacterium]
MSNGQNTADSPDLEALFDSIVEANAVAAVPEEKNEQPKLGEHEADNCPAEKVINEIGHMTRALHDSLRELGYDKMLENVAQGIPDTKDRLAYVAAMTEQAAERALNATEVARPIQEKLGRAASELSDKWQKLLDQQLGVDEFRQLVMQTCDYLREVPIQTNATNAQLTEIMMAQDFQDLTGQVIKKVTDVAQTMEQQLLKLLLDNVPVEKRAEAGGLLNGPVFNAAGRTDVVTNQQQVDDLLESLGF